MYNDKNKIQGFIMTKKARVIPNNIIEFGICRA